MRKIVLDAESFYSTKYSLRRMTPVEYILGSEWETIGWGVQVDDKPPVWLEGDRVADLLRMIREPWMCITHNALFDACILAFRYGIHPTLCVDTMSMSRALLSSKLPRASVSLENVSEYLKLPPKGKLALGNVKGMRLADIKAREETHYKPLRAYCLDDVRITRGIFDHLSPLFPPKEFILNHMIIRMATRPQFAVDRELLAQYLNEVVAAKTSLLERAGVTKMQLQSNDRFAALLLAAGVEPEMKPSPTNPNVQTYAFAKTDTFMEELLEHEDPDVQSLAAARLGIKSTIEETRTQRFINIANITFDGNESWMPIPLKFSGAHTHRFSGDWKINAQNLGARKTKKLRQSLKAPARHVVLAADAAQIEARLTAWLAGCATLIDIFAANGDPYGDFATDIYGYPVSKANKKTKLERLLGKISILGLGFGMGWRKFEATVRIQAADQGVEIDLAPLGGGEAIVGLYRRKYSEIPKVWRYLDRLIQRMYSGKATGETFGPCVIDGTDIILPTGLRLYYDDLKYERDRGQWSYWDGRERKSIWGGTILENIVQALDRVIVMDAALRIAQRTRALGIDLQLAHQVHDEIVYVPRIEWVDIVRPIIDEEMARRPSWGETLPLASESKVGATFGELE